jgi:hypothetical protein
VRARTYEKRVVASSPESDSSFVAASVLDDSSQPDVSFVSDASSQRLAASAEAAVADLERQFATGLNALERAQADRVRAALARLLECARGLASGGLMIPGSMGQQRPHPLLKTEQELRREIIDGLQTLVFAAEQRAAFEQARDLTRRERSR